MALEPEHGPWPEPTNSSVVHAIVGVSATVLPATANCQECNMVHLPGLGIQAYRP